MKRAALAIMTVALVGACGTGDGEAGSAGGETATLRVNRTHAGGSPVGLEGSVAFARVTSSEGEVVADGGFDAPDHGGGDTYGYPRTLEIKLQPGTYTLTAYQRSCDGTCANLDRPADGYTCETELTVDAGSSSSATVAIDEDGCTVAVDE